MVTLEGMLEALDDCLKYKKNHKDAIEFESNKEKLLTKLVEDINNRTYIPKPAGVIIVTHPKPREVFCADFLDRIIDHWISLRLMPLLEKVLIPSTFSCMKGRGTLACLNYVQRVMKVRYFGWSGSFDISGYFNSLDKELLWLKVRKLIKEHYKGDDIKDLLYLNYIVIHHDPTKDCIRKSPKKLWKLIPPNRSLFNNPYKGVAIGRLTAQMYGNLYLNDFDHIMYDYFQKGYARYVDDFKIISCHKTKILNVIPIIRKLLAKEKLMLHPHKCNI